MYCNSSTGWMTWRDLRHSCSGEDPIDISRMKGDTCHHLYLSCSEITRNRWPSKTSQLQMSSPSCKLAVIKCVCCVSACPRNPFCFFHSFINEIVASIFWGAVLKRSLLCLGMVEMVMVRSNLFLRLSFPFGLYRLRLPIEYVLNMPIHAIRCHRFWGCMSRSWNFFAVALCLVKKWPLFRFGNKPLEDPRILW